MFALMNTLVASVLLNVATLTDPVTPKVLPFSATAYINNNNQIRLSISKETDIPLVILLRDNQQQVLLRRTVSKKEHAVAMKLIVNELTDGQYELEVKSDEGSFRKQLSVLTAPVQQKMRVIAIQ